MRELYNVTEVAFEVDLQAEIGDYDEASARAAMSSLYEVTADLISLQVAAGSVLLSVTVRTSSEDAAVLLAQRQLGRSTRCLELEDGHSCRGDKLDGHDHRREDQR